MRRVLLRTWGHMNSTVSKSETHIRGLQTNLQTIFENNDLTKSKGFLLAVVSNLIWGTSFLASKVTLNFWRPFTASVLRFTIAIVAMLIVFPIMKKSLAIPKSRQSWTQVFFIGLSGFGLLYPFQLRGLTEIPSSLSACIMLTSPLFVLLLSAGVLREQLSQNKLVAIALGIIGGVLLINPANLSSQLWSSDAVAHLLKGSTLTFLASVSLAVSVLSTRSASKELDSYSITFWSMVIGLFLLLPFAFAEGSLIIPASNPADALLALLYLALVCSVMAFLLWNKAIACASPQKLASTMHIKTPVAVVLGVVWANEPITWMICLGTGLISFAVWLSQRK